MIPIIRGTRESRVATVAGKNKIPRPQPELKSLVASPLIGLYFWEVPGRALGANYDQSMSSVVL